MGRAVEHNESRRCSLPRIVSCALTARAYSHRVRPGPMTEEGRRLSARIDQLEERLRALQELLEAQHGKVWLNRSEACKLLNVSSRHLFDLITRGVIRDDALRNVGTARRPRYVFHREKALNQYISRAAAKV